MASGPGAWRQLLTHDDVTKPGQLESITLDGLRIELAPDETLVLVERNVAMLGPGTPPPMVTIVGIRRETDGAASYIYLYPDRRILFTSNFARPHG